ncbi:MAG: hypothetical protein ACPGTU_14905, partial [Myxococcota bacterium]
MLRYPFMLSLLVAGFLCSCSGKSDQNTGGAPQSDFPKKEETDSGVDEDQNPEPSAIEIVAGLGIGPAQLGGTYGDLVSVIGPPDSSFEYFRVVFALWFTQGIEVVFSSGVDATLSDDSPIVSVGTKLSDGYVGPVVPGMTRNEAESLIGECVDVIDDVHCYHPIGLYLGFDPIGIIQTVAIHPAYTTRSQPPEMEVSLWG